MIYGCRRMIYLLRKCDITSVPFIREAYIICEADIIALAISSASARNGYHCKSRRRMSTAFAWRRVRDSNPRFLSESLVFKTSSINHSDNSP